MVFVIILFVLLLVICGVLLYMLAPAHHRQEPAYFCGKKYAHRGLHGGAVPENSLAAFRRAVEGGYGVELDVQETKDGQIVVFHDGALKRMCGEEGHIKDYTYEELCEFRLANSQEKIPLFSEVLEVLGETDLICELKYDNGMKNPAFCEKVYQLLETYRGRYCIESFSPFLVQWFRMNHPEVVRGQLASDCRQMKEEGFATRYLLTHLLVNVFSRPDFVAYRHQDSRVTGFVICRALFHPYLFAWTTRGEGEIASAWDKKFDSVIFEELV